jgi:hypothetical protein
MNLGPGVQIVANRATGMSENAGGLTPDRARTRTARRLAHALHTLSESPLAGRSPVRLLLFALLAFGGCVLPLSPEFEEQKNLPPYLVSATPPVGTLFSGENPMFSLTVQDPNPPDTFYVRWLIDYPPRDVTTRQLAREYEKPSNPTTIEYEPNCILDQLSTTNPRHRLMVLVSDRPFLAPEAAPDRPFEVTAAGTYPLRAVWLFDKRCH